MKTLHQQGQKTANLCQRYGVAQETIQHLHQCTHEGSRGIWTAAVYALQKWLEAQNTDPEIVIILADAIFNIAGERNDLPQCLNLII